MSSWYQARTWLREGTRLRLKRRRDRETAAEGDLTALLTLDHDPQLMERKSLGEAWVRQIQLTPRVAEKGHEHVGGGKLKSECESTRGGHSAYEASYEREQVEGETNRASIYMCIRGISKTIKSERRAEWPKN